MDKHRSEAWLRFTSIMTAYTTLCFAAGIMLGSMSHVRHTLLLLISAIAIAAAVGMPLCTRWLCRPDLTRHRWPKHEIWKIVVTEIVLGCMAGVAFWSLMSNRDWNDLPLRVNYSLFVLIVVVYHKGESIFVLFYHTDEFSWHCYLIYHSKQYVIAQVISQAEYFVEAYFFYQWKSFLNLPLTIMFVLLAISGLVLRNLAFHEAKSNFHHLIRYGIDPGHRLVTTGIYAWDRHPSYVGFYLMSMGLQLLLKNSITTIGFYFVLRWFFKDRIECEEATLIEIFGESYIEYSSKIKSRTG